MGRNSKLRKGSQRHSARAAGFALLALLLDLAMLSCRSDQAVLLGWQENAIAQKLNIQQYLYQDSEVSLRFFYQTHKPEQSYAEIRSLLLPNTILYARAAGFELAPAAQSMENAAAQAAAQSAKVDAAAGLAAEAKLDFNFPLELQEVGIFWQVEGTEFEIRYQLSGLLALTRNKPDDSYFNLERLSDLRLGDLLSLEMLTVDGKAVEVAEKQSEENSSTANKISNEVSGTAAEPERQSRSITGQQDKLLRSVGQYLDNLNLFMAEIFAHRQNTIIIESSGSLASKIKWGGRSARKIEKTGAAPAEPNTGFQELRPLPLVEDQLDDVLAVYFFPETLSPRQQYLVPEEYRSVLEKQYNIVWPENVYQGQQVFLPNQASEGKYTWSTEYSNTMFKDERLRQLRNSGHLWGQYQTFKEALQVLYNLRYVPSIAIPQMNQLKE